ncbi:discoidin domain-containing protein [Streptomyces sp. MAR4 CNX-425]|uniref:discoidin domain-containing protein n=1 Tax=Streptomyces sp. MAR4 CNX-425 TaxID=3406343 RepID=UPI003B5051AF
MPGIRRRAGAAVAALAAFAALSPLTAPAAPAGAAARAAAGGELLVVQANLQEAVRPADAAETADLDNFVDRLTAAAPAPPDALLLTEVLGPGARHVAERLGRATGQRYRVAVAPGDSPYLPDGAVRESAIVVNADTVRTVGTPGFHRVQSEDQAYAVVQTRDRPALRAPLVSAHVAGSPAPAAEALAGFLAERHPPKDGTPQAEVLGGDFRGGRCAEPVAYLAIGCAPALFWDALTDGRAYRDTAYERGAEPWAAYRNYLFARGDVRDGFTDAAYRRALPDAAACKAAFDRGEGAGAPAECRDTYYADQPFSFAVLGAPPPAAAAVVPGRAEMSRCELGERVGDAVARVANYTAEPLTREVTAAADAPLSVSPAAATLRVPAQQARAARISLTAPAGTPPGEYPVRVRVGGEAFTVPVTVTPECTEPRVYATSWHSGFEPERAADGDPNTFWHSEYVPVTPLPQSLTLNLGEVRPVSGVTYQPRVDGNLNGTILDYTVYVSADGRDFTEVAAGTWARDARLKTASFAAADARYVRLEAHRASGGDYASAAEVTAGAP